VSNRSAEVVPLRFSFRDRPADLIAVFVLTAILAPLALFSVASAARIVLGLVFILLFPGYVLTAALFPEDPDLDWIERIALSVGLSISLVALIGLALNFSPWGVFLEPILASLLLLTYGVGAIAWWRRAGLIPAQRLSLTIDIGASNWSASSRPDKIAIVAVAASLVFAAGTVVYVAVTPRPAERFTEFYILNATGVAGGYPKNLTVNETAKVNLTVHNVEYTDVAYVIRVYRATMEAFFNASANRTQYRELSRAEVRNFSFDLFNGDYWNRTYSISMSNPGIYRLYFNLYKIPETRAIYRYVFLTVLVRT
jgi:uncharacterized membrane protein